MAQQFRLVNYYNVPKCVNYYNLPRYYYNLPRSILRTHILVKIMFRKLIETAASILTFGFWEVIWKNDENFYSHFLGILMVIWISYLGLPKLYRWSAWWFPFSWECHHPIWRTPSFFRGVGIPLTSDDRSYKWTLCHLTRYLALLRRGPSKTEVAISSTSSIWSIGRIHCCHPAGETTDVTNFQIFFRSIPNLGVQFLLINGCIHIYMIYDYTVSWF